VSNPEVDFELSERGRNFAARLAANPLDLFQGKTLGWLEDFIRITVSSIEVGTGPGASIGTHTVGHLAWICKDLTAQINEYVYEDDSGQYLYLNGAAVSQTTYADLYTFYGPNAYGTDSGGLFFLPDARGRAPFLCGTNSNTDLGDSDGMSLVLRQALHQHAVTGTVASHSHDDGTLAVASHTHAVGTYANANASGDNHTHTFSGTTATVGGLSHTHPPHPDLLDFWGGTASGGVLIAAGGDFRINSRSETGTTNVDHQHNFSGTTDSAGAGGSHTHTISGSSAAATPDVTGSTGTATPSVSGTAGSGMSADGPAHIFIGSLVVRF
jgi:microcystin-dependent protein